MACFNHGDVVEHSPAPYSERFARFARVLGEGAVKRVYAAVDKDHGKLVAWNEVDIRHLPFEQRALLEAEVGLLRAVRHVNIIDFYGSWATENAVVFITEIVESGDLRRFYSTHRVKLKVIKKWCRQILSALAYLHEHSPPVVHRDIKCENMLYNATEGTVKVGDLGLSCSADVVGVACADSRVGDGVCGTPAYMAPEVYEGVVNEGIDIYAFGMAVLEMISHAPPYSECTNSAQIFKRVIEGVKPAVLNRLRFSAIADFINFCITLQHGRRPSAHQVLAHPFLDEDSPVPEDEEHDLIMPDEGGPGDGISHLLPSEPGSLSPNLEGFFASVALSDMTTGPGGMNIGAGSSSSGGLPFAVAIGLPESDEVDEAGDGWEAPPTEQLSVFLSVRGLDARVDENGSGTFSESLLPSSGGPFFDQPPRFFFDTDSAQILPSSGGPFFDQAPSDTDSPVYRMSSEVTPIVNVDAGRAALEEHLTETPFTDGRSFPIDSLLGERNESFPENNFLPPAFTGGGSFSEGGLAMGASFGEGVLSSGELATDTMLSPTGVSMAEDFDGANIGERLVLSSASNGGSGIDHVDTGGSGKNGFSSDEADHNDGGSLDSVGLLAFVGGTRRNSSNMTGRVAFGMDEGGDWPGSLTSDNGQLMRSESMADLEHMEGSFLPHADFATDVDLVTRSRLWADANAAAAAEEALGVVSQGTASVDAADVVNVMDLVPSGESDAHERSPVFSGSEMMSSSLTGSIEYVLRSDGSNDDGHDAIDASGAVASNEHFVVSLTPAASTTPPLTPVSLTKLGTPTPALPESRTMFAGRTPMLGGRAVGLLGADIGSDSNGLLSQRSLDENVTRGDGAGGPLSVFSDDLNGSAAALNLFSPALMSSVDSYAGLAGLISPVNLVPFTPQQRQNSGSPRREASPTSVNSLLVSPESAAPVAAFTVVPIPALSPPTTFPLELVVTHGIGSATPASVTIQFNFDSAARADADQVPQEITHSLSKVFSENIDWGAFRPFLASLLETQRHGFSVSIRAESTGLHVALGPPSLV